MLLHPASRRRSTPPAQSLRREYEEFIEQRIEEYKDQLSRHKLLSLGDDAVRELEAEREQLVLTEVLVLEQVDRLIRRRLRLPSFRRWRDRHVQLRFAQRQPTHWDIPLDTPLTDLIDCLESGDVALVLGAGAATTAFFIAAHDTDVLMIDQELAMVEAAEGRAASEALGDRFHALVVRLGGWFPDIEPALVILEPAGFGKLDNATQNQVIQTIKRQTRPNGAHISIATAGRTSFPPDSLRAFYDDWLVESSGKGTAWFMARRGVKLDP